MPPAAENTMTHEVCEDDALDLLDGRQDILDELDANNPDLVSDAGVVQLSHSAAVVHAVDTNKMSATFTIVTRKGNERNRQGNRVQILPSKLGEGLRTDLGYEAAPVVLFDHGMSGLTVPVALSQDGNGKFTLKKQASKATATAFFRSLPHSEAIFAAVAEDLLRMASIGFDPLKAITLAADRNRKQVDGVEDIGINNRFRGIDFVESELLEWSITPIGADRGSLKQALHRGKIHDVRIPQFLRQSFELHAGPDKVWSPGADFSRQTIAAAGVTVEGDPQAVQAAVERLAASPDASPANDPKDTPGGENGDDGTAEEPSTVDRTLQTSTIQPEQTKPQVTAADLASVFRQRKPAESKVSPDQLANEVDRRLRQKITREAAQASHLTNESN